MIVQCAFIIAATVCACTGHEGFAVMFGVALFLSMV